MNIPDNPSINYFIIMFFALGLLLFLAGLDIMKFEKIHIHKGFKSWSLGLLIMIILSSFYLYTTDSIIKNIFNYNLSEKFSIKEGEEKNIFELKIVGGKINNFSENVEFNILLKNRNELADLYAYKPFVFLTISYKYTFNLISVKNNSSNILITREKNK